LRSGRFLLIEYTSPMASRYRSRPLGGGPCRYPLRPGAAPVSCRCARRCAIWPVPGRIEVDNRWTGPTPTGRPV